MGTKNDKTRSSYVYGTRLFYTIINHRARKRLKVTTNEFCIADTIYHLANNPKSKKPGWAYIANTSMAHIFDLTEQTVITLQKKLLEKGLLEKSGHLKKTTLKWYNNVVLDEDYLYNDSLGEIQCYYCGKTIKDSSLEVEYRVPKSRGGVDDKDNLVLSCSNCNKKKGSMTDVEFINSNQKIKKYQKTKETLVFGGNTNTKETLVLETPNTKETIVLDKPKTKETLVNNNIYINNNNNNINNKEISDYFILVCKRKKGVDYLFHGTKDGSAIARFLKIKEDVRPDYKKLINYFMSIKKSDEHLSISAALSTDTINNFNLKQNKKSWQHV